MHAAFSARLTRRRLTVSHISVRRRRSLAVSRDGMSDGAWARIDEEYDEEVGEERPCAGKWVLRGEGWTF